MANKLLTSKCGERVSNYNFNRVYKKNNFTQWNSEKSNSWTHTEICTIFHSIMCIINSISQCINITVSFKTLLLYMFNFLFPVQSEPLYVPVKFQDVPAEHSNCLMGDCESCKYTEWRIQMEYVSLLPLIVQKLCQKISWTWALTSWELILSPLWEIQQVCFSADFTKGNYPQFIVL